MAGLILITLVYFPFRKSSNREIAVSRIEGLRTRRIFGSQRYSFLLSNGKVRDIPLPDSEVERNRLLHITEEAGIPGAQ